MAERKADERKRRLVTQLDEDAVCRPVGYTARTIRWLIPTHRTNWTAVCLWSRVKMLQRSVAYVLLHFSPRLSGEIRSRARAPPSSSSSFHLPPHSPLSLCLCSSPPLFFYLSTPAHILTPPPVTDSFFIFSTFCLHTDLSICLHPSPLLWLYFIPLHPSLSLSIPSPLSFLFLSLCSYLWSDYEAYHGISESHGMY